MPRVLPVATLATLALAAARLSVQTPAPLTAAAETITAQEMARQMHVLAACSLRGRGTPSRALELTARYVADQFRQLGLRPGGDGGRIFTT